MPTATITKGIQLLSSTFSSTKTYTDSGSFEIDESIPDGADTPVALTLDVSQMSALYIESAVAMTLETNNGTTPDDTIALAAGVPVIWASDDGTSNPFTTDVTGLFLTQSTGEAANFKLIALFDVTV